LLLRCTKQPNCASSPSSASENKMEPVGYDRSGNYGGHAPPASSQSAYRRITCRNRACQPRSSHSAQH
jgi:hypothetical protein